MSFISPTPTEKEQATSSFAGMPAHRQFWSVNHILVPVLSSLLIVAGTILATKLVGPFPLSIAQSTAPVQNWFYATGESEITTVPDQAEINLGIVSRETTVAAAQNKTNQVIAAVTEDLNKLGVKKEDITTQDYSIYPEYDYTSPARAITSYSVTTSLRVKMYDFEKLNQAIDAATKDGVNQVNDITFSLSKDRETELKKEARKEAIENAKKNAQELAQLSGLRLGKIINVTENSPYTPEPIPFYPMATEAKLESAPTNVEPGSTLYKVSVSLTYEIF